MLRRILLGALFSSLCFLVLEPTPQASAAGSGYFSPTGRMSTARTGAAAAPLADGRVLVAGGSSAEVFDPSTNTFSSEGIGPLSTPRVSAVAAPLPDGRVLVAGGIGTNCDPFCPFLSSAEVFDPATNTFSSAGIGSMSVSRYDAVAAPLPDGRVLVAGGCCSSTGSVVRSSAEIFDPDTNTFSSAGIGSMSTPRKEAVAAPLPDGRVLVAGGDDPYGLGDFASAEVFDPATNTFSSAGIGSMSIPRRAAVAAALPDGRVLVAGGYPHDSLYVCYLSSAEVFDPTTNTFSSEGIGPMSRPRASAFAAPLSDGVLVGGGYYAIDPIGRGCPSTNSGDPGRCAEIFRLGVPPERPALPARGCVAPAAGPVGPPQPSAVCRGHQTTILGSLDADRGFRGTPGADVIAGLDGNDDIFGLAGNDVICGGPGKDTLSGQGGKDNLSGDAGNDTLAGGSGKDVLEGGPGKDILRGGPGNDVLKGGFGRDIFKGGPGKDTQIK